MDDIPRVNIPQRSKQAPKVCLDPTHRQRLVKIPKIVIAVIRHDNDNLVAMSKSSYELRDMSTTTTVIQDGNLIANAFWVGSYVYAFYRDEDFF